MKFNTFPYSLDHESIRTLMIQVFNNQDNYSIKLSLFGTNTKRLAHENFILEIPKSPNRRSFVRLRRLSNEIEDLKEHLDILEEDCSSNTHYGQCRKLGSKSEYYKFCDAAVNNQGEDLVFKLVIHGEPILIRLNRNDVERYGSTGKNCCIAKKTISSHNMFIDHDYQCEVLSQVINSKLESTDVVVTFNDVSASYEECEETKLITIDDQIKEAVKDNFKYLEPLVQDMLRHERYDALYKMAKKKMNRDKDLVKVIASMKIEARAMMF